MYTEMFLDIYLLFNSWKLSISTDLAPGVYLHSSEDKKQKAETLEVPVNLFSMKALVLHMW